MKSESIKFDKMTMTCDWNKHWTPIRDLLPCDWVACLKPPNPPSWSSLGITGWFGEHVLFGHTIKYVCDRNMFFEDDKTLEFVEYTSQDCSNPDTTRGFFDVPAEDDWPICTDGIKFTNI